MSHGKMIVFKGILFMDNFSCIQINKTKTDKTALLRVGSQII